MTKIIILTILDMFYLSIPETLLETGSRVYFLNSIVRITNCFDHSRIAISLK